MDKEGIKTIAIISIIAVISALVIIGANVYNSSLPPVTIDYANGDVYRFEQPSIDYEVRFFSNGEDTDKTDMGISVFDKNNFVDVVSFSGIWSPMGNSGTYYLKKTGKLEIRKCFFIDNTYPDNVKVMFWITSENYEDSTILNFSSKEW